MPIMYMALGVSFFVLLIMGIVIAANKQERGNRAAFIESTSEEKSHDDMEEESYAATYGKITADDLDIWDMYPETTATPMPSENPSGQDGKKDTTDTDPSTDGKHTLVTNRDGKEEWVLISPYLPKHEYDFTKLVCQSDFMKYYQDGKLTSYVGVDISKYQDYVDFLKLKKAGIDFVMLRVGARGYGSGQIVLDEYFADNLKRATDAGLQIGVYFTSQAITEAEAVVEANVVLNNFKDY